MMMPLTRARRLCASSMLPQAAAASPLRDVYRRGCMMMCPTMAAADAIDTAHVGKILAASGMRR